MNAVPRPIDIVKRLIDCYNQNGGGAGPHAGTMFDETRTWNNAVHDAVHTYDIDTLRANNAQLREALVNARIWIEVSHSSANPGGPTTLFQEIQAALAEGEKQ